MSVDNFVQCRVVTPLSATSEQIVLMAAELPYQLPPEDGGLLVLTDSVGRPSYLEVISYTNRNGLVLYGVVRGLEGTEARTWNGVTYTYQALTADQYESQLALKVDKVTGKQLSTEDYSTAEKAKLSGIATGAQVNTVTKVAGRTGDVVVSKADVGLGNADNTSDANKPVSTAQKTALDLKVDKAGSVTSVAGRTGAVVVAKADVGLGNADNTSDANKPVSAAQQAALDLKVDKAGSVTSVAGRTGAVVVAKADVGLGNVDNTSDASKPVSTAQQTALDGKLDKTATAAAATKLATARTIALSGDASGSASFDGSANATITVVVADDSHNHIIANIDGLQAALDAKEGTLGFIPVQQGGGANQLGNKVLIGWGTGSRLLLQVDTTDFGNIWPISVSQNAGTATKLQTARTIALSGDASGSASFDGTGNVTIPVVVADDSHSHTIANVDGLQAALDAKLPTTGTAPAATKLATARTIALTGDATGSASFDGTANATITVVVADDSHNHTVANVDGLQTALDAKLNRAGDTLAGELVSGASVIHNWRSVYGNYGTFWRQDGSALYLMVTASGDQLGSFTSARPLTLNLSTGVASINGNAATATKLATARTISLAGDASGSVSFDGTGNVSLTVTVADDSHNHTIANVDGLQTALNGKAATGDNDDITTIRAQRYVDKRVQVAAATGTVTLNCQLASVFELTLTGNTTLAFSNLPALAGELYTVLVTVTQGATARTLTLPADTTYITGGGAAITTPAANKRQDYIFSTRNGSAWEVRAGAAT